ncbi:MAG: DUF167 domain-containing protein [bacterium]
MARIAVRVSPGAREDAVTGWQDNTLRVRVRAAAEQGKANEAVCRLIAKALDLPRSRVSIARGATARGKVLHIEGIDDEEARHKLGMPSR